MFIDELMAVWCGMLSEGGGSAAAGALAHAATPAHTPPHRVHTARHPCRRRRCVMAVWCWMRSEGGV